MSKLAWEKDSDWNEKPDKKFKVKNVYAFSELYQLLYGLNLFGYNKRLSYLNTSFIILNFFFLAVYLIIQLFTLYLGYWSSLTLIPFAININNLVVCIYLFFYRKKINRLRIFFCEFLESGQIHFLYELLFALYVISCFSLHGYLVHTIHDKKMTYGSIDALTSHFGLELTSSSLSMLDMFTVGYNSNYSVFSFFVFVFACHRFLLCSEKLNEISQQLIDNSTHFLCFKQINQQLTVVVDWVQMYMQTKRKLQKSLGFLFFMFLVVKFVCGTLIVIIVYEIQQYRVYRIRFISHYLLAYFVPLIVCVLLVERCEYLHVLSHKALNQHLLNLLSQETRSDGLHGRQLMAAYGLLRYGMQQTTYLTAWNLVPINRRLPLKFYNINVSFIVMVYNFIKPSIKYLDKMLFPFPTSEMAAEMITPIKNNSN